MQRIKTWQLWVLFVLVLFIAATFLRLNNIGMVQRREAVISADKEGNTEVLHNRLYDLQRYSAAHMNAATGDIYLQESYNREQQRLLNELQARDTGSNNNAQQQAEAICKPQAIANGWRWNGTPDDRYSQCLLGELSKMPAGQNLVDSVSVDPNLFKHSFISPLWSPDFAGFTLLLSGVILLLIVARVLGALVLRLLLRRYYASV